MNDFSSRSPSPSPAPAPFASGGDVDARQSPFYEWLNNAAIRDLVHRSLALSVGERLVLIKGLVPGLVQDMGFAEFEAFLAEVAVKARRFQEAVDHPGEGRSGRATRGEELGGPVRSGHDHLAIARDPSERGAREAERAFESEFWSRTVREESGRARTLPQRPDETTDVKGD